MNHHSICRLHIVALVVLVTGLAALLAGCRHGASGNAQRYDLKGTVVSVDARGETVTISHQEIPGYMDAMTMPFKPKDRWVLDQAQPGNRIQATLVVDGLRSWLEDVVLMQDAPDNAAATTSAAEPQAGAEVPDFALTNQDGKRIALHDYHGHALVLTFIYTRCPLPDYCPLMTNNFAEIVREIRSDAALYNQTRLFSVTVDPEYDTPAVLREYGAKYTGESGAAALSHWQFATGKPDEIKQVAAWFGLQYWPEGGQIVHSLRTAVIAPDGKLVKIYRGNDWRPAEIVADLRALKSVGAAASGQQSVKEASLQKGKSTAGPSSSLETAAGAAKLYHAVGVVESIGDARTTVQINHEDIKDLMPAMSMSFEVQSAALLDHIAPGDRVSFTLQETPHGLVIIELRKP
ncbi:MAG: copper-binding protein [Blastocatellia bacterium]